MKLSQAAQAMDARMLGQDAEFNAVRIDSRRIEAGDLFVAIQGDRFDGHDFVAAVNDAGAVAAVVSRAVSVDMPQLVVADTRRALGLLAARWADQSPARRVAVTGNAGKTTVKEMIACMLGEQVLATRGNLNNDIGVPLTLLELQPEHHFGVFELGANAPGEIAWTVSLVRPEVALVTNVTGAHLEGFGSMQGIANAKAEIFEGVQAGGAAVINLDDDFAEFFSARARAHGLRVITVSVDQENADLYASDVSLTASSCHFRLHRAGNSWQVDLPLPGRHQVINSLMAAALVFELGLAPDSCLPKLAQLQPVKGRMNLMACQGGMLVDDSYNANPGAVKAAAQWLVLQSRPQALVLGDIAELGPTGPAIMRELGAALKQAGLDMLVTRGELADEAGAGFGEGARAAQSYEEAAAAVAPLLAVGGTVLVKGSRSAAMEHVVEQLKRTGETD